MVINRAKQERLEAQTREAISRAEAIYTVKEVIDAVHLARTGQDVLIVVQSQRDATHIRGYINQTLGLIPWDRIAIVAFDPDKHPYLRGYHPSEVFWVGQNRRYTSGRW